MKIAKNSVVSMQYTLTNDAGEILDSSSGRDPLVYLHGTGGIIPGLENALSGKVTGDNLKVTVAAKDGYGLRDLKLIESVPRSAFAGIPNIAKGMQFQAQTPHGTRVVTVVDVRDEEITIDANHALAGKTLHFDVNIVNIRAATKEELQHGHVHGPGGHHH